MVFGELCLYVVTSLYDITICIHRITLFVLQSFHYACISKNVLISLFDAINKHIKILD